MGNDYPATKKSVDATVASVRGTKKDERGTENDDRGTQNDDRGTRNHERGTRNDERGTENDDRGTQNEHRGTKNNDRASDQGGEWSGGRGLVKRKTDVARVKLATEPPIDRNLADLAPSFRAKLNDTLSALASSGMPFRFVEGFRTVDRQQWLYGSGRPRMQPYGRPGPILTNADGVRKKSKHQGTGTPGTARAADCYPMKNGSVYIPPTNDPAWQAYAAEAKRHGLTPGYDFVQFQDAPHVQI